MMARPRLGPFRLARWLAPAGLAAAWSGPAAAGVVGDYLSGYQPGAAYGVDYAASAVSYRAPLQHPLPTGCSPIAATPGTMSCTAQLGSPINRSWSFFLQHRFHRTGLLLLDYDLGFSFFDLDGQLAQPAPGDLPQPLTQGRIHLYGLDTKAYVQTGITPVSLPDVLLAAGFGIQTAGGNVLIQTHRQDLEVLAPIAYAECEIVWLRFGHGALSSYISAEAGGNNTPIYNGTIDGMSHFTIAQGDYAYGLVKIVLPIP